MFESKQELKSMLARVLAMPLAELETAHEFLTALVELKRSQAEATFPKKRGRPSGSKRKAKVNGHADATKCPVHGTPMTMYAGGPACGKCAQEGEE